MNIILFVSSILMILALMTYAKMDAFRYFLGTEAQFEKYTSTIERSFINDIETEWYLTTKAPKPKNAQKKPQAPQSKQAASRLSFKIFVDQKFRETKSDAHDVIILWAKNLMTILYQRYDFYKEALQKDSTFLDKIFMHIQSAADRLPEEQKPTNAKGLSNLDFENPEIQGVFYRMLKGCPIDDKKPKQTQTIDTNIVSQDGTTDQDDQDDVAEETEEFSKEGYDSLLNYISLSSATQIKVYLASRPLLQAIFGQSSIADEIISARKDFYTAVKNGQPADEASEQFKNMFLSHATGGQEQYLDFKVTLTNPSSYD